MPVGLQCPTLEKIPLPPYLNFDISPSLVFLLNDSELTLRRTDIRVKIDERDINKVVTILEC